jgi:hypothetical protein
MFGPQLSDSISNLFADVSCHTPEYGKETAELTPHECPIILFLFVSVIYWARVVMGKLHDWTKSGDRPPKVTPKPRVVDGPVGVDGLILRLVSDGTWDWTQQWDKASRSWVKSKVDVASVMFGYPIAAKELRVLGFSDEEISAIGPESAG